MSEQPVEVIEYTDPLCSIVWGTAPVKLFQNWDAFKAGHRYAVSRRSALYGFNDRSALPVGEGGGTSEC